MRSRSRRICHSCSMASFQERSHVCKVGDLSFDADGALDQDVAPGREDIEPWLSALLQAEHCSLLLGSGFTMGACALIGAGAPSMSAGIQMADEVLGAAIECEATRAAGTMGRGTPNLEDRLRTAMAAEAGLRIVNDDRVSHLRDTIGNALRELVEDILGCRESLRWHIDGDPAGRRGHFVFLP